MPEYINPNKFAVHLVGPNNEQIRVRAGQRITLDEYFDKYRTRGYLRRVNEIRPAATKTPRPQIIPQKQIRSRIKLTKTKVSEQAEKPPTSHAKIGEEKKDVAKARKIVRMRQSANQTPAAAPANPIRPRVVGRRINADANELLKSNLDRSTIPISNNIGVGILSYNRLSCLRRLVDSVMNNTDLHRTTVFISDDGSTDIQLRQYLNHLQNQGGITVIQNQQRIGVAGNHNRLIRCLSRFKYGLMLNDDVEVLKRGWEHFYVEAMTKTGMHHFMYRQAGIYRADRGKPKMVNDVQLLFVDDKPHGAVLAFDRDMLITCGYFNEAYGLYGMEHVDWSQRAWEFNLQPLGFWDVSGSDEYFRLHQDASVIEHRSDLLRDAKTLFQNRVPVRCGPTEASRLPEITYIIPFRNIGREDCIRTVVNNIRAQQFPVIYTILVEQDRATRVNVEAMNPVYYHLAPDHRTELFNKSRAFNFGASTAFSDMFVLHDADMLVQGDYTAKVAEALIDHEACHMGKTVLYADQESTNRICESGEVSKDVNCDRIVGYFEGGSLACHRSAYWKIGGFCEDFWGYGCEDCDFYARLVFGSKWIENRQFDFLHLWHDRVAHWNNHHKQNKERESKLNRLSLQDRINLQRERLAGCGWQGELQKWTQ